MSVRLLAMRLIRPLAGLVTSVNFRIGPAPLTGADYRVALTLIRPGDLILTRTEYRPMNMLIPGKWSHVEILHGDPLGTTTEATYPLVRESSLVDIWTGATEVMIVRPRFASAKQAAAASAHAYKYIGLPYDTTFELGERAFYCSELAMRVYADAGVEIPEAVYTTIAGRRAIGPSSLENPEYFETIWHGGKT